MYEPDRLDMMGYAAGLLIGTLGLTIASDGISGFGVGLLLMPLFRETLLLARKP